MKEIDMGAIFAFIGIRGTIAAGLGLALIISLGLLKLEHNAKLRAQAERDTAQLAASISQQQILLYQEREEVTAKAEKKRGKLNEWQTRGDVDSLVDDFNAPGGVRRNLPTNPQGGAKGPASKYRAQGTGEAYQEAP
jgi:hypothetical protein